MTYIVRVFIAVFSLLILSNFAFAQGFEGVISMTLTNEQVGEKSEVKWHKKGNNHRMDIHTQTAELSFRYSLIVKENDSNLHMLTDVNGVKNDYRVPFSKLHEAKDLPLSGAKPLETSGEASVSGFQCTQMEVENYQANVKYWLTKDLDLSLTDFPYPFRQPNYFKYLEKKAVKGIPIKIIAADADGQAQFTQTINSAKAGKVDAALFEISAEYVPK